MSRVWSGWTRVWGWRRQTGGLAMGDTIKVHYPVRIAAISGQAGLDGALKTL